MTTESSNPAPRHPAFRWLVGGLKVLFCGGLIAYLLYRAQQEEAFADLLEKPKDWSLLAAAFGLTVIAVLLSFVRWWVLTRAAGLKVTLHEAIRVGALGFALNFVGPGAVSGDFFKAVIIARGRAGQRAAVFTTIVVDRVMGLFSMLLAASFSVLVMFASQTDMTSQTRVACQTTLWFTLAGVIGIALLFVPGLVGNWLANTVRRVPGVGELLGDFIATWDNYRRHALLLAAALGICLVVDVLFIGSFYCVARGLPLESPPLLNHFFIVPLELTAGALPITPGGVGTREMVVDLLYEGFGAERGQGGLIAFTHSLTMLAAGGLATLYYLSRRAKVQATMAAAEG